MRLLYFFIISAGIVSCCPGKQIVQTATPTAETGLVSGGKLFTAFYQQQAAEYKALCFQAYNLAALRLSEELKKTSPLPRAVVTDIDETMLDNSPYAVHQALQGKGYDLQSWMEWTAMGACDTLAGALSFFKYAASNSVEIFYISNREEGEREGTLKNLQRYGFPFADNEHLILRESESSKESRRQRVAATHNIVLYLGDNLPDFHSYYDKKPMEEREKVTVGFAAEFGKRFIVLPNPNYGDWESSLWNDKARQ